MLDAKRMIGPQYAGVCKLVWFVHRILLATANPRPARQEPTDQDLGYADKMLHKRPEEHVEAAKNIIRLFGPKTGPDGGE